MTPDDRGVLDNEVDKLGEVDRLQERLRLSEIHLKTVLESVDECFYALDTEWRFTLFNRASEEYFGVSREEIL